MLERAVDHARRLDFKLIVLETVSMMKEAIRLYTRSACTPSPSTGRPRRRDATKFIAWTERGINKD